MNKYKYIFFSIIFLVPLVSSFELRSQNLTDTVSILFIGNSFTVNNDCPGVFKHVTDGAGKKVCIGSCIHRGGSVKDFINNDTCWTKIKSRNWDYIVFQDYQAFYGDTLGVFPEGILEDNLKFQEKIKKINHCAKIIYTAGWENRNGFKDRFPKDNMKRLIHRIMANYAYLNNKNGVHNIIAPVGLVWLNSMQSKKDIQLYLSSDNRHPTRRGTDLFAITMYVVIFKSNPEQTLFFGDVGTAETRFIANICYKTVMDTFGYTNIKAHSIKITKVGNLLIADPFYQHYQWFKNDKVIDGANSFIHKKDHFGSKYTLKAIKGKGCKMESLTY